MTEVVTWCPRTAAVKTQLRPFTMVFRGPSFGHWFMSAASGIAAGFPEKIERWEDQVMRSQRVRSAGPTGEMKFAQTAL